jgi:MFS family permease
MRPTVLTEIVPSRLLSNAVGLNTLFFQLGRLIGPSAAGFLIAGFGNGPSFVLGATALGVFALVLTRLPRRRDVSAGDVKPAPAGMRHAVRFVIAEPRLRLGFVLTAVAGLISPNILSLATLAATRDFAAGATGVGLLGSALAVGTIAGAALTAALGRVTPRSIAAAAVGVCLLTAATGLLPTFTLYALALVPTGMASMLLMAQGSAFVQLVTPPTLRGRVNALFAMVTLCGIPLGSPVLGILADAVGARSASVLAGAVVAVALGFVLLALRGGLRGA